jgi:hypothetical protein
MWFDSDENDFGCELALCGFDERERSAVIEIDARGKVTRHFDTGFCAIGEGWSTAMARLELLRYQPWVDLGTVLYMAIDAKLTAERVASVGPTTDAWVLLPHRDAPLDVPSDLVATLAAVRAWDHRRSAFQRALPGDPPLLGPDVDWQDRLMEFVVRCYDGAPKALALAEKREAPIWRGKGDMRASYIAPPPMVPSGPSVTAPPSSLSQIDGQPTASRHGPSRPSARRAAQARQRRGSFRLSQQRRSEKP